MGFVSGWAATWADAQPKLVNPLANLDEAALVQWISNYCAAHPLDKLAAAAYALTSELEKRQKSN